jgi:hypothetical protein
MPKRIQRRRTKGWKAPAGVVNCTRPGKWGNPVKVSRLLCAESAKRIYSFLVWPDEDGEKELNNREKFFLRVARSNWEPVTIEEIIAELGGKDLMCFCALDAFCHVDVLLELANK